VTMHHGSLPAAAWPGGALQHNPAAKAAVAIVSFMTALRTDDASLPLRGSLQG
jgi:hypothetical protein